MRKERKNENLRKSQNEKRIKWGEWSKEVNKTNDTNETSK